MPDEDTHGVSSLNGTVTAVASELAELERLHGFPVLLYHSAIEDDSVERLYDCLRALGSTQHLGIVLATRGGSISSAHRIAVLVREFTERLTIFLPYRAWSAGTLLCLAADELAMSSMAELSPIDANIESSSPPPDALKSVAAEEVRRFPEMAREWFGVTSEEARLQLLALLTQRMFPPSLVSLFRADRLARATAEELLAYQVPGPDDVHRSEIADRLISGYFGHNRSITRGEAAALGLRVRAVDGDEESILWRLWKVASSVSTAAQGSDQPVVGSLIVSRGRFALKVRRPVMLGTEYSSAVDAENQLGWRWQWEDGATAGSGGDMTTYKLRLGA
jgi:hypothetical protein